MVIFTLHTKIDEAYRRAAGKYTGSNVSAPVKQPNPFEEELKQANRRVSDLAKLNELAGVMEEDGSGGYVTGADGKPRHHYQLFTLDVPSGSCSAIGESATARSPSALRYRQTGVGLVAHIY